MKTAVLNVVLAVDVWIAQHEGYAQDPTNACYLLKSIYRLRQAPYAWSQDLHQSLTSSGLRQNAVAASLYVRDRGSPIWLLVYVDDPVCATSESNLPALQSVKLVITQQYGAREL